MRGKQNFITAAGSGQIADILTAEMMRTGQIR